MQRSFSIAARAASLVLLAALVLLAGWRFSYHLAWGPEAGTVELEPITLDPDAGPAGWHLVGAWRIDHRLVGMSGLSGLAFDDGGLVAVTDGGQLIRFDPPAPQQRRLDFTMVTMPDEVRRDAESLVVAHDSLFVAYERDERLEELSLDGSLQQRVIAIPGPPRGNRGIEAMALAGDRLLAFAETGEGFVLEDGRLRPIAVSGQVSPIVGADVCGGEGELLVLQRPIALTGFPADLATARFDKGRVRVGPSVRLPLARYDNAEGLAVRARGDGGADVWIVTDDNQGPPQRTLLVHYRMDPDGWPIRPKR